MIGLTMEIEVGNYIIDIWPLAVLLLIALVVVQWRRKRSPAYLVCLSLFGLYILAVLSVAIFPIAITGAFADSARAEGNFMSLVNLTPFYFGASSVSGRILAERISAAIIQNIILTIPFGFGASFVIPVRRRDVRWLVIAGGLGIEATQLMISLGLGYAYRVIDVNDVILNALGVLVGYGLFRVFAWIYLKNSEHLALEHEGLSAYVYTIASQA
ncbi:MAG: VanZ family protein [Anaerolineae bacterium]|nr:VanZ family protein [Anaerolineae bacterium]